MGLLTLTLCLTLYSSPLLAERLETMEYSDENAITCGKGLTDCRIRQGNTCIYHDDSMCVSGLAVRGLLCHVRKEHWRPCLRIDLNITTEVFHEASGLPSERGAEPWTNTECAQESPAEATVQVCCSTPDISRHIELTFTTPTSEVHASQTWISFVILLGEADFGSTVMALSSATLKHNFTKRVLVPSIDTVCSQFQAIALCNVPSVSAAINHTTGMAELRLDSEGSSKFRELQACQKMEAEGECFKLEWKENALLIPVSSVAPCLCFQVWWTMNRSSSGLRKEFCPFFNSTVLSISNVSVSVMEAPTTAKASTSDRTALHWNITASCRLDVQLRLCKKVSDTGCHEMKDLMNTMLHIHNRQHQNWKLYNRRWQLLGEFVGVERHPSICVQIKVKGMDVHFVPVCPFEGAVGASQVVLLYPPDVDRGLAELVCGLASCLSSLGFNVSLDMWSRSELSALGPVPWLHSRLDRVQRHGGKVVLVLNQAAWARVEERGRRSVHEEREEHRGAKEANARGDASLPAPPCSDVFSASLSCILADYLQGRAGERFVLAQFEAQPAGPPLGGGPLPELFRGLPLFSLPSQSLSFLTELTRGAQRVQAGNISTVNRRARAGMLRVASRALAGTLRELTGGAGHRLPGLPQDCVGFGAEDAWESIPLQPGQSSPPDNPDLPSKTNTANWV
ncbi:hypothetical protein P4O66_017283 [Electrophorus voltai]|uniref:SEFIR domain-containing protein n=1 Tax=Electrophorus voltai TaxID=2609070 RepID=A0AAD9DM80_9TELE|nr:hypothetical protein P4O66_017283 [Electrophorus voltai]